MREGERKEGREGEREGGRKQERKVREHCKASKAEHSEVFMYRDARDETLKSKVAHNSQVYTS